MPEITTPTVHHGAIVATTGTFSGAVSMTALTATTGSFSGAVTLSSTLVVTGTITGFVGGTGSIKLGQNTDVAGYKMLTLNGDMTDAGKLGISGGGTGDTGVYIDAPGEVVFRPGGSVRRMSVASGGQVLIGLTDTTGGVAKSLMIGNVASAPASNPVGGGIVYVEAGALKYRGSSGTVTSIAAA